MMDLGIYYTVGALGALSVAVLLLLHFLLFETVRVYNWNGRRYVLVGRSRIRHKNDKCVINITGKMADASWTTDYCLVPNREFIRQNRYRSMVVCAGDTRVWLPVEERMRHGIYYRRRL
jgi:hypothetical protein